LITAAIAPQQVAAPTIIATPRQRFDSTTADSDSDKNWQLGKWAIGQFGDWAPRGQPKPRGRRIA
jgi:hypothetical protein